MQENVGSRSTTPLCGGRAMAAGGSSPGPRQTVTGRSGGRREGEGGAVMRGLWTFGRPFIRLRTRDPLAPVVTVTVSTGSFVGIGSRRTFQHAYSRVFEAAMMDY